MIQSLFPAVDELPGRLGVGVKLGAKMYQNRRGNPAWLPILRAATSGRPYNILFVSG